MWTRLIRSFSLYWKSQNFHVASDWLFDILHTPLYWLNFIHFSGYKLKIKLILRLIKRGDQALISISAILEFSAQVLLKESVELILSIIIFHFWRKNGLRLILDCISWFIFLICVIKWGLVPYMWCNIVLWRLGFHLSNFCLKFGLSRTQVHRVSCSSLKWTLE